MLNQHTKVKTFEKLTWTIENFSEWDHSEEMYSETFILSGLPWQINICSKKMVEEEEEEEEEESLSIYLNLIAGDLANLAEGWSIFAKLKLSLIDQANDEMTIVGEAEHEFDVRESGFGFTDIIELDELCDSSNGFIVNDTCLIEVEIISVSKSEHESQVDEAISKNLVDFRGFGKIEKAFVPLLEDVCSRHPSIVDCLRNKNRTRAFTEWAFAALGRVLHFLETKKVKDMDDDACDHLKILWGELETFGFDLTWLKPHFQSVMAVKGYLERHAQVKQLRGNVDTLQVDLNTATKTFNEGVAMLEKIKETIYSRIGS